MPITPRSQIRHPQFLRNFCTFILLTETVQTISVHFLLTHNFWIYFIYSAKINILTNRWTVKFQSFLYFNNVWHLIIVLPPSRKIAPLINWIAKETFEAHFARVLKKYVSFLKKMSRTWFWQTATNIHISWKALPRGSGSAYIVIPMCHDNVYYWTVFLTIFHRIRIYFFAVFNTRQHATEWIIKQ